MKLLSVLVFLFQVQSVFANEPQTVAAVDLNKYIGQWYEIASIPQSFQKQCIKNTTADYSFAERGLIKVINSCDTESGERSVAEGRARVEDSQSNAKLKVTFVKFINWVFAFGGNYWIIDLDDNYDYAVVGDPTKEYAWILARNPALPLKTLANLEYRLRQQGYDTSKILTSIQDGGFKSRQPLNQVVKRTK